MSFSNAPMLFRTEFRIMYEYRNIRIFNVECRQEMAVNLYSASPQGYITCSIQETASEAETCNKYPYLFRVHTSSMGIIIVNSQ